MTHQWTPHTTVAAVIERDGRFLLVEEHTAAGVRFNQPAGHWEAGETLIEAARRETLEETGYHFAPRALVGVYSVQATDSDIVYLRFAFCGDLEGYEADRPLDTGIIAARWLTPAELAAEAPRHRSPLVPRCIADYQAGRRVSLDLITHV